MLPLFPRKISLNLTVQWGVKTATFYQRSVSKNNDCHKMYLSKKVSNCEANTPFLNDFFIFSDVFSKKSKNPHVEWMDSISAAMHIIQYSCRPINTMVVRQKKSTTKRCFQMKCDVHEWNLFLQQCTSFNIHVDQSIRWRWDKKKSTTKRCFQMKCDVHEWNSDFSKTLTSCTKSLK